MSKVNVKALFAHFTPHEGFELMDYYGISVLQLKKNNKFSIKLIYDFHGGRQRASNALILGSLDEVFAVMQVLYDNRKIIKEEEQTANIFIKEEENW